MSHDASQCHRMSHPAIQSWENQGHTACCEICLELLEGHMLAYCHTFMYTIIIMQVQILLHCWGMSMDHGSLQGVIRCYKSMKIHGSCAYESLFFIVDPLRECTEFFILWICTMIDKSHCLGQKWIEHNTIHPIHSCNQMETSITYPAMNV